MSRQKTADYFGLKQMTHPVYSFVAFFFSVGWRQWCCDLLCGIFLILKCFTVYEIQKMLSSSLYWCVLLDNCWNTIKRRISGRQNTKSNGKDLTLFLGTCSTFLRNGTCSFFQKRNEEWNAFLKSEERNCVPFLVPFSLTCLW